MTAFDLPEEMKPPQESDAYEKVKNPWRKTSYGKSEFYWRKIPESRRGQGYRRDTCPQKAKERVKERDKYQCRNCRNDENLEVHHIVPVSVGGRHNSDNLVTLCDRCHNEISHPHNGTSECSGNKRYHRISKGVRLSGAAKERFRTRECANCKKEGKLYEDIDVHIIVPLNDGGHLGEGNISFLCEVCHSATHGRRDYSRLSD